MAAHKAAFPPPMTMTSNSFSVEMEVEIGVAPEWYWQTSPFAGPPLESCCYSLRSRIATNKSSASHIELDLTMLARNLEF
jgi:hypothetical protein